MPWPRLFKSSHITKAIGTTTARAEKFCQKRQFSFLFEFFFRLCNVLKQVGCNNARNEDKKEDSCQPERKNDLGDRRKQNTAEHGSLVLPTQPIIAARTHVYQLRHSEKDKHGRKQSPLSVSPSHPPTGMLDLPTTRAKTPQHGMSNKTTGKHFSSPWIESAWLAEGVTRQSQRGEQRGEGGPAQSIVKGGVGRQANTEGMVAGRNK